METPERTLTIPIRRDVPDKDPTSANEGLWSKVCAILEGVLAPWILELLPWAPWYLPLVERFELEDRDIYRPAPMPVRVRRTWSGEYCIALAAPAAKPSEMLAIATDGRVMLDVSTAPRRTYSFSLPKDCSDSTLEGHMTNGTLTIVARKTPREIVSAARVVGAGLAH